MSKCLFVTLWIVCVGGSSIGLGQDRKYPVLNSVGRYFGVGYTNGGYHAGANGQPPVVKMRHPANHYGSQALSYPYHPSYQPYRPAYVSHGQPSASSMMYAVPSQTSNAPTLSPKPLAGPPPEWLKPYLENGDSNEREELPTPRPYSSQENSPFRLENEQQTSPSDRPASDRPASGRPTSTKSSPDNPASTNQLNGGDDDLLDTDDDLLLLDANDLSLQLRPSTIRGGTAPEPNRYKSATRPGVVR